MSIIFSRLQGASLSRYISFTHSRLPREQIKELVVEMRTIGFINQDVLREWNDMMLHHNRIIERGERMNLFHGLINIKRIKFSCVDHYMLQMQSKNIANLLDAFSRFGERVLPLIRESPAALLWIVVGPILIERVSWCRLCSKVMALLHALGLGDQRETPLQLSPWPDRDLLEAAIARASSIFGLFARSDAAVPSVRSLLPQIAGPSRHTVATGGAPAPAAEPPRRAAKRGRSDPEPSEPRTTHRSTMVGPLRPTPPSARRRRALLRSWNRRYC
jgi:hypothetical protein